MVKLDLYPWRMIEAVAHVLPFLSINQQVYEPFGCFIFLLIDFWELKSGRLRLLIWGCKIFRGTPIIKYVPCWRLSWLDACYLVIRSSFDCESFKKIKRDFWRRVNYECWAMIGRMDGKILLALCFLATMLVLTNKCHGNKTQPQTGLRLKNMRVPPGRFTYKPPVPPGRYTNKPRVQIGRQPARNRTKRVLGGVQVSRWVMPQQYNPESLLKFGF